MPGLGTKLVLGPLRSNPVPYPSFAGVRQGGALFKGGKARRGPINFWGLDPPGSGYPSGARVTKTLRAGGSAPRYCKPKINLVAWTSCNLIALIKRDEIIFRALAKQPSPLPCLAWVLLRKDEIIFRAPNPGKATGGGSKSRLPELLAPP